jgi:FG-GAP-like repeat
VTGALIPISGSPFAAGSSPISMAIDPSDKFAYVVNRGASPADPSGNTVSGYTINGVTGALTPISGSPFTAGPSPVAVTTTPSWAVTLPAIVSNPAQVEFNAGSGQGAPSGISVAVISQPGPASTITVTTDQPWLLAAPSTIPTGSAANVSISVNPSGLVAGSYHGTVRFNAPNYLGSSTAVNLKIANPSAALVPAPGSPFVTGLVPFSIAVGDFNGDGTPDLAIANQTNIGGITVLLGNGAGGFTTAPGSPLSIGRQPTSIVAGDFNGDGKLDLAVTNTVDNTVMVLLGNGLGGFTTGKQVPVGILSHLDSGGRFQRRWRSGPRRSKPKQ